MTILKKVTPGGKRIYEDIDRSNAQDVIESRQLYLESFEDVLTPGELQHINNEIESAKYFI